MRLFIAVPLSPEMVGALIEARDAFLDAEPGWRGEKWVASENLHLTLRFLGDVPPQALPALSDSLRQGVSVLRPFELRLSGLRAVPTPRKATMLWGTFEDPQEQAGVLARVVTEATLAWTSEEVPTRPFRAHATLVRARRRRSVSAEALEAAEGALAAASRDGVESMSVRRAMLMSSTLTAVGPVYEEVFSARLSGV